MNVTARSYFFSSYRSQVIFVTYVSIGSSVLSKNSTAHDGRPLKRQRSLSLNVVARAREPYLCTAIETTIKDLPIAFSFHPTIMPSPLAYCLIVTLLLPLVLAHGSRFQRLRFGKVVIFGDSYTDTDNVYKLSRRTWPLSPPYYRGRFCNGPIWLDQLHLFRVSNYAYGGATTDNNFVQGSVKFNTLLVPGVRQQVGLYLKDIKSNKVKVNYNDTLFILWAGGNDLYFNKTVSPFAVVASLLNSVKDLLGAGAKHLLVFNAVPAQSIPASQAFGVPPAVLAAITNAFNAALKNGLGIIQNSTDATISLFDINLLISKVVADKSSYFTNTVDNCWIARNATTIENLCGDPGRYVFVDLLHFTSRVHDLIANAVRPFLLTSYAVNNADCYVRRV